MTKYGSQSNPAGQIHHAWKRKRASPFLPPLKVTFHAAASARLDMICEPAAASSRPRHKKSSLRRPPRACLQTISAPVYMEPPKFRPLYSCSRKKEQSWMERLIYFCPLLSRSRQEKREPLQNASGGCVGREKSRRHFSRRNKRNCNCSSFLARRPGPIQKHKEREREYV